ncbi:hypothetical protein QTH68_08070 [Streptococcus sp. VTCC 12814]|uniref:hypothetical protein n=1 Tax=Streptococcus raffinosi TaxID=3053355 RepID=UPI002576E7F2|nr:hypothetical protein [Streptococcus sp. VTCC 12814]MDM0093383.1 hypothetical protein [Streptococcus sp. VTCC 12814]
MNLENGGNKMKKSKKKVVSTMDERARLISAESAAGGYWVAMLGMFVTIMVASKTHSVELVQSLLIITFFGSMCVVLVHSVSRNGHPWLLDKKIEKRVFVLSWVILLFGIVMSLIGLLSLVQSFKMGKNFMSSVTFLTLGLVLICDGWVILKRIKKNRLEELEDEE